MLAATYREFGNVAADGRRNCSVKALSMLRLVGAIYVVRRHPELRRSRSAAAQSDGRRGRGAGTAEQQRAAWHREARIMRRTRMRRTAVKRTKERRRPDDNF